MESLFLTRKQICEVFNTSESKARAILSKYGVQPVDYGRGRGNGLHWYASAVKTVADTLHGEAQAKKVTQRKSRKLHPLQGRSAEDLYAEFSGGTAPVQ